ncbi:hypothetical protein HORM4_260063 [Vibrio harveyi]|nr:hypothetical protein VCHENC01_1140 [Vibrio harveyi]CAK6713623.1 hypothetical protein HORM4_260063 [Vibrio harveyi]
MLCDLYVKKTSRSLSDHFVDEIAKKQSLAIHKPMPLR